MQISFGIPYKNAMSHWWKLVYWVGAFIPKVSEELFFVDVWEGFLQQTFSEWFGFVGNGFR